MSFLLRFDFEKFRVFYTPFFPGWTVLGIHHITLRKKYEKRTMTKHWIISFDEGALIRGNIISSCGFWIDCQIRNTKNENQIQQKNKRR